MYTLQLDLFVNKKININIEKTQKEVDNNLSKAMGTSSIKLQQ